MKFRNRQILAIILATFFIGGVPTAYHFYSKWERKEAAITSLNYATKKAIRESWKAVKVTQPKLALDVEKGKLTATFDLEITPGQRNEATVEVFLPKQPIKVKIPGSNGKDVVVELKIVVPNNVISVLDESVLRVKAPCQLTAVGYVDPREVTSLTGSSIVSIAYGTSRSLNTLVY